MSILYKEILVVLPLNREQKERLESAMPGGNFHYVPVDKLEVLDVLNVSIIIGNIPIGLIKEARELEWLQLNNAGTEGYTKQGILKDNVILTNASGAYGTIISEHMLGMLLSIQKKLNLYHNNQKLHEWHSKGNVATIEGATTLIVGLGDLGDTFGRKMKALGSKIIGIRKRSLEKPDYIDEIYKVDRLDEALPKADIVALCLPGYEETYNMMTKERMLLMKKDAILINVGRGTAIQTDDLCEVLDSGHLKGVCLDVTNPEPLPKEHKLWNYENVFITPHVSGSFRNEYALDKIVEISASNLRRFKAGEALLNEIDLKTGYCK